MANIQILAGDFLYGVGTCGPGVINVETALYPWPGLNVPVTDIKDFTLLNQAPQSLTQNPAGMGLAATLALAPLCAVTDTALSHDEAQVTFWVELKDGRKMLCLTDADTYRHLEVSAGRHASLNTFPALSG